jgi:hypothetical protein
MAIVDNSGFYEAQKKYLKNRCDKNAWDNMFMSIYNCSLSCVKKIARKHLDKDQICEKAMDSAIYLMNRYKTQKDFKIEMLEYMCKMTVHSFLHRKSVQRRDKSIIYTDNDFIMNKPVVTDFIADIEKRKLEKYLSTPAYEKGGFDELSKCRQIEFDF